MYKELIQICKGNVQSLKSQIGMCEAQITFGTKMIKNKYKKIQDNLQIKLGEESYWYKKYVCLQYLFQDSGLDLINDIDDNSINRMYNSMSPEDIEMCSQF